MTSIIQVTPATSGLYHDPNISAASAAQVTSLLQKNHDSFHIYWNDKGYHNHQVHYLLTAYALGASAPKLQDAFDRNAHYQRPLFPLNEERIRKLANDEYFISLLGCEDYFHDLVAFFERKFEKAGWQMVVQQYLFSRSKLAEELLVRLFAGVVHPLIHFGFGIEFQQPGVIAEALAQTACHTGFFAPYLLGSEKLSSQPDSGSEAPLIDLIRDIRKDSSLWDAAYWGGGTSLDDKVVGNAPKKLYSLAARWRVDPEDLDEKTAEMISVDAWVAGAAPRPPKEVKLDFFLMHLVNSSMFFTAFNNQSWLTLENKARLLEWKGRIDLITYAARLAPELDGDEITSYQPREPNMTWPLLFQRVNKIQDDGHISKLVRALAHGSRVCSKYEGNNTVSHRFLLNADAWLQLGNMAVDTTETCSYLDRWVRCAGSPQEWEKYQNRSKQPGAESSVFK